MVNRFLKISTNKIYYSTPFEKKEEKHPKVANSSEFTLKLKRAIDKNGGIWYNNFDKTRSEGQYYEKNCEITSFGVLPVRFLLLRHAKQ